MKNASSPQLGSSTASQGTGERVISLGLQGGAAYGAFTWGVLDRLLGDERIRFDAISGTSAGAINALVIADGMAEGGGRAGAQRALNKFWRLLGDLSRFGPVQPSPLDYFLGRGTLEYSPGYHAMQMMSAVMAPLQGFSASLEPMRLVLSSLIDFERVRRSDSLRLFIHATNVRTGKGRLFTREEMDVQCLMAAICLPQSMGAVEIDGEAYWDGSYLGNPALDRLAAPGRARDLVIVQNNPVGRAAIPRSLADINTRSNEITFNISLMRQVAAILHANQVIDEIDGKAARPANVRLHLISGIDALSTFSLSSKFNTGWPFLSHLHQLGAAATEKWLAENFQHIGVRSTLQPETIYDAGERLSEAGLRSGV